MIGIPTNVSWVGRAHVVLTTLSVIVVAVSGVVLRGHLTLHEDGPLLGDALYGEALRVHGAMSGALLVLPLVVLVGATVALPRWHGRRPLESIDLLGVVAHAAALALWAWSLGQPVDPWALPTVETPALVALQIAIGAQGLSVARNLWRGAWRRSPLAWSLVLVALASFVPLTAWGLDALQATRVVLALGALGWASELWSHPALTDRLIAGLLAASVATAIVIAVRIAGNVILADTFVEVGATHLLDGMTLLCIGLALLRPPHRPSLVRVLACVLPFVGMAIVELVGGDHGVPRRYWRPLEPAPLAWWLALACIVAVAVTLITWWRTKTPPAVDVFD